MKRFFRLPWRSSQTIADEVDEEIQYHLDARTDELVASGTSREDARAEVLKQFGDLERARKDLRSIDRQAEQDRRRRDFMGELKQDIRYAVRSLGKAPTFAITAILTLALGIGANTAIFSLVNGVLLKPLPFPHPEQLVQVWTANRRADNPRSPVSIIDLDDWRAEPRRSVSDLGGVFYLRGVSGMDLTGSGEPQRLSIAFVTPGFFTTLGVNAEAGRVPREDQMNPGGDDRVVVLSHGFWERQFGGSRNVLESVVTLNGQPFRVLGIMPRSFNYPGEGIDAFVPFSTIPESATPRSRPNRLLTVIARLAPGQRIVDGANELSAIARRIAQQFPENASWDGVSVSSLDAATTAPVRSGLLVLWGAVAFVLLMACVNVAGLLLARAAIREREIAIRTSLGGTRGRVVRQLLTESVVLALMGGVAGVLIARVILGALLTLTAGQLPRAAEVQLDGTVLIFAFGLSVLTGVIFGLVPALRMANPDLQRTLREGGRGLVAGQRLRSGLVVTEVALAVLLTAGAGLMTKSFVRLLQVDPGFGSDHLVAVRFTISTDRHPAPQYRRFYHEIIDRVRDIPGVISAGAVKDPPFQGAGEDWGFLPEGMVLGANEQPPTATVMHLSDGYFRTVGAQVIAGREFAPTDGETGPFLIVINQALARRYFPGRDPIGRTLDFRPIGIDDRAQIIGVVADLRQSAIDEMALPAVYVNNMFQSRRRTTIVARTQADLMTMAQRIRDVIWSLDKDQTITSVFTYEELMGDAVARPRLLTVLLAAFGALGLGLGALGIYGLLAYVVSQRQREIGVRLALGADRADVLKMIVGRGLRLALLGLAIGVPAALYFSAFLRDVLYGVQPADPVTFVTVAVALLATALLASYLPARRAAGTDPAVTLRSE